MRWVRNSGNRAHICDIVSGLFNHVPVLSDLELDEVTSFHFQPVQSKQPLWLGDNQEANIPITAALRTGSLTALSKRAVLSS